MNNNDQQFNDNNFDENTQSRSNSENTYEYVFSNGSANTQSNQKKSKKRGTGASWHILTIAICIVLSFAFGFAGTFGAKVLIGFGEESTTEVDTISSETPEDLSTQDPDSSGNGSSLEEPAESKTNSLFYDNPEELFSQAPASPSDKGSAGEDVFSVSQVASAVLDTVVVVNATVTTSSFWGETTGVSTGSGVIITANGYIVTCHHVIDRASSITVILNSGEEYKASLVGSDATSDIALLHVDAEIALPYAGIGNSSDLVLGEQVVAIGNPLGELYRTVTAGVISGLNRNILTSDGTVMTLLQTDAAVNSGNSGGGLFNLDGELIGIVNAKYAEAGVEGLAFAIPVDWANEVLQDLMKYGYVRGIVDHGLNVVEVNQDNYRYYVSYGINSYGVYVVDSKYCEDLQNKDRIISVNGVEITTEAQMKAAFYACKVGDVISILYSRDGNTYTTELTLQEYVPDAIKNEQN